MIREIAAAGGSEWNRANTIRARTSNGLTVVGSSFSTCLSAPGETV